MKTPPKTIDRAVALAGGVTSFASKVGRSRQTVWSWRRNGARFDTETLLAVCESTKWKITPHQLQPKAFQHPEDGLPAELRGLPQEASA